MMLELLDHIFAVYADGTPAHCTCGLTDQTADLLAHAREVL